MMYGEEKKPKAGVYSKMKGGPVKCPPSANSRQGKDGMGYNAGRPTRYAEMARMKDMGMDYGSY